MILLDPRARPVIGHRGNRAHAPENTVESLREAVALGVDAVEFDLRVSRDGVLVVMHDETLGRTTDGSGPVALRTVAELKRLDAGARFTPDGGRTFPWRGRGVSVPDLRRSRRVAAARAALHRRAQDARGDRAREGRGSPPRHRAPHHRGGIRSRRHAPAARRRLRARCVHARCRRPGASCAASSAHRSAALSGALHSAALERHSGAHRGPGARAARQRHRDPCLDRQRPGVRAAALARWRAGNPQR